MTGKRVSIGSRPAADRWVDGRDRPSRADLYTARLTIDVTPALRARIKLVAFSRHLTVADMLRALLEREFAEAVGGAEDVGEASP